MAEAAVVAIVLAILIPTYQAVTMVQEVGLGETAVLNCPSNDDYHRFQFWQLQPQNVMIGPTNNFNRDKYKYEVLTGTLHIRGVSSSEQGVYTCICKHLTNNSFYAENVELIVKRDWEEVYETDPVNVKKEEDQKKEFNKLIEDKVNTEDFICEIEKYPVIWDSTKEEYANKIEKRNAWQRVINTFIDNFDDKGAAEKNALVTILQKKWKGIRSCYSRELLKKKEEKSGAPASGRKQYIYFDVLRFLDTTSKQTENSIEEVVNEDVSLENEEESINQSMCQPGPSKAKRPSKKRANEDDILIAHLTKKLTEEEDRIKNDQYEDRLFLLSLVSELQKVPAGKKMKLKADIITAIDLAQKESHVIQPPQKAFLGYPQPGYSQTPMQWGPNIFPPNQ